MTCFPPFAHLPDWIFRTDLTASTCRMPLEVRNVPRTTPDSSPKCSYPAGGQGPNFGCYDGGATNTLRFETRPKSSSTYVLIPTSNETSQAKPPVRQQMSCGNCVTWRPKILT